MLLRFCLKVSAPGYCRNHYIKANTAANAFIKFSETHPTMNITKIEVVGDPLPPPEKTVQQIIKEAQKANAAKRKRWIAAKKYESKSGTSIFAKK